MFQSRIQQGSDKMRSELDEKAGKGNAVLMNEVKDHPVKSLIAAPEDDKISSHEEMEFNPMMHLDASCKDKLSSLFVEIFNIQYKKHHRKETDQKSLELIKSTLNCNDVDAMYVLAWYYEIYSFHLIDYCNSPHNKTELDYRTDIENKLMFAIDKVTKKQPSPFSATYYLFLAFKWAINTYEAGKTSAVVLLRNLLKEAKLKNQYVLIKAKFALADLYKSVDQHDNYFYCEDLDNSDISDASDDEDSNVSKLDCKVGENTPLRSSDPSLHPIEKYRAQQIFDIYKSIEIEHRSTNLLSKEDSKKVCMKLCHFYWNGIIVRKDTTIALELFLKAGGFAVGFDDKKYFGSDYRFEGRFYYFWESAILFKSPAKIKFGSWYVLEAEVINLLKTSADKGYAVAQYLLGWCYENGFGTPVNLERAFANYAAAASKNVFAHLNLANCYMKGLGTPKNIQLGLQHLKKIANYDVEDRSIAPCAGLIEDVVCISLFTLGIYYFGESKIGQTDFEAREYFIKALTIKVYKKDPDFITTLINHYKNVPEKQIHAYQLFSYLYDKGIGVGSDKKKAQEYHQKSLDLQGLPTKVLDQKANEEHKLAPVKTSVNSGAIKFPKEFPKEVRWQNKFIDPISPLLIDSLKAVAFSYKDTHLDYKILALIILGELYLSDEFVKDEKKAVDCFETAIKSNNYLSIHVSHPLAICYANGIGTDKNLIKAIEHFDQAAKLPNSQAKLDYAIFLALGDVPANYKTNHKRLAFEMFLSIATDERSLHRGAALYYLGVCYEYGFGTETLLNQAINCYRAALIRNEFKALEKLKTLTPNDSILRNHSIYVNKNCTSRYCYHIPKTKLLLFIEATSVNQNTDSHWWRISLLDYSINAFFRQSFQATQQEFISRMVLLLLNLPDHLKTNETFISKYHEDFKSLEKFIYQWIFEKASYGNPVAQYALWEMTKNESGELDRSVVTFTLPWLFRSALQEYPEAICALKDMEVFVKNDRCIVFYIEQAARKKYPLAKKRLVQMADFKYFPDKDLKEIYSEEKSTSHAQWITTDIEQDSDDEDSEKMLKNRERLAMIGDPDSQYQLAKFYENPEHRDLKLAIKWYNQASLKNHEKASKNLERLLSSLSQQNESSKNPVSTANPKTLSDESTETTRLLANPSNADLKYPDPSRVATLSVVEKTIAPLVKKIDILDALIKNYAEYYKKFNCLMEEKLEFEGELKEFMKHEKLRQFYQAFFMRFYFVWNAFALISTDMIDLDEKTPLQKITGIVSKIGSQIPGIKIITDGIDLVANLVVKAREKRKGNKLYEFFPNPKKVYDFTEKLLHFIIRLDQDTLKVLPDNLDPIQQARVFITQNYINTPAKKCAIEYCDKLLLAIVEGNIKAYPESDGDYNAILLLLFGEAQFKKLQDKLSQKKITTNVVQSSTVITITGMADVKSDASGSEIQKLRAELQEAKQEIDRIKEALLKQRKNSSTDDDIYACGDDVISVYVQGQKEPNARGSLADAIDRKRLASHSQRGRMFANELAAQKEQTKAMKEEILEEIRREKNSRSSCTVS